MKEMVRKLIYLLLPPENDISPSSGNETPTEIETAQPEEALPPLSAYEVRRQDIQKTAANKSREYSISTMAG